MARKTFDRDSVRRVTLSGLLTAVMLVLGYIESLLPSLGLPGIKLGLSNGVLIFAVYMLDIPTAYILMAVKVTLSGLLFSGVSAMLYAFAGGLFSLTAMCLLSRFRRLRPVIISMAGGMTHNLGQMLMALLITRLPMQFLYYLAILTAVGLLCGLLTGVCAEAVMRHLKSMGGRWARPASRKPGWALIVLSVCVIAAAAWLAFSSLRRPAAPPTPAVTPKGIHLMTTDELPLGIGK